jgi:type I restriction enzyme M protein
MIWSRPGTDKAPILAHGSAPFCPWKRWESYRGGAVPPPEPTPTSWTDTAEALAARGYDLSAKNPNRSEAEKLPHPVELTATLLERNRELHAILGNLHSILGNGDTEGNDAS